MSGNLERRLNKLQVIVGAMGCPTCEPWHRTRVQIVAPPTDAIERAASPVPSSPPPARCPDCGRRIPRGLTTLVQIIAPDAADGGIVGE
jgi:hypothetical protein